VPDGNVADGSVEGVNIRREEQKVLRWLSESVFENTERGYDEHVLTTKHTKNKR